MKLDRNINPTKRGKYALVNMRMIGPLLEQHNSTLDKRTGAIVGAPIDPEQLADVQAFERLHDRGFITLGDESYGDQFFVMKYKDRFTAAGLRAYAIAVAEEADKLELKNPGNPMSKELKEFSKEIFAEGFFAEKAGYKIPD